MQFIMIENETAFKVTEQPQLTKMTSKGGRVSFEGPVSASYKDPALKTVPSETAASFLMVFGQKLKKSYDGKFTAWKKTVQGELDKLDSKIEKAIKTFEKAAQKKRPSGGIVKSFVDIQNGLLETGRAKIEADAIVSYKAMVESIVHSVRKDTVKSMGSIGKLLKKDTGSFTWTTVKFIAAVVVIVITAIALPPLGIALAIAALVTKGLSATTGYVKECIDYSKQFNSAIVKVDKQVSDATGIINKAIADMRIAKDASSVMQIKMGQAIVGLDKAKAKAASEAKDKEVAQCLKTLEASRADMVSFNKAIGGNPDMVITQLGGALKALKESSASMPVKTKGGSGSLGDIIGKLDNAAGKLNDVVGNL